MFESAELGHEVTNAAFEKEAATLRADLLDAQNDLLADASFPVIVLVNGVNGAGKGETVNLFNEWMDPRHIRSHAFGPIAAGIAVRPPMWRFWQTLPANGKIAMLFGSWYSQPVDDAANGVTGDAELTTSIDRIRRFERMLTDEGAVIVKLWFHISKKDQKKHFKKLERDELTAWRVTKDDWSSHKRYEKYKAVSERVLRETSTGEAPWVVIDGHDSNYRELSAGRALLLAIKHRLAEHAAELKAPKKARRAHGIASNAHPIGSIDTSGILANLKFDETLTKHKYSGRLKELKARLNALSRSPEMKDHAVVVVMEGSDAAGKGGTIRRMTQSLDARRYDVIPIAAPNEDERAHPYLWRFWRHIPAQSRFVIFDRSWYGRVLVERVEGFASEATWKRAYAEINDFEDQLARAGIVVVKLWLAISKEEQLTRFKAREKTRFKRFKITPDDWRNRERWDDYLVAASDMIDRTSTAVAPWRVLESNDKHLARVRALETVCERIEGAIGKKKG